MAQKVFLSWDPQKKTETLVIQPRIEGDARDFALIVATPAPPTVEGAPADFFHELAVFTQLAKRSRVHSDLKDPPEDLEPVKRKLESIRLLDQGTIGTLKHQIITTADELLKWLKENGYERDNATAILEAYIKKKWCFTCFKIDPQTLQKGDGRYVAELRPLRFTFATEEPVYPLYLDSIGAKDFLDVTLYVQAPYKMDLAGDLSYQYHWAPLLWHSREDKDDRTYATGFLMPGADEWFKVVDKERDALTRKARELGFGFVPRQRPRPNSRGRSGAALEWAKRLTATDIKVLRGEAPYTETVPNLDEGFKVADYSRVDVTDERRKEAIFKVIESRRAKYIREQPLGYLVRAAPAEDVKELQVLAPFLRDGQFVTKMRKVFGARELTDDLRIVPARLGGTADASEYTELLPASPR